MGLEFKSLLDQQYSFPCRYTFKFVLELSQRAQVLELLGEEAVIVKERSSREGKYLGLTLSRTVGSSDEVIDIYERAADIQGVMAL